MAYGTINADVIQSSVTGVSLGAGNATVFKNRIINGDMRIDQRNAGASVTITTTNPTYTLDRWAAYGSVTSKYTVQQNAASVTLPAGFSYYLGATSSAATSVGSTDYYYLRQAIEGFNSADLGWGTANAKTVTLSFQVYSSLTGTFGGGIRNSANNYCYPFSYTISSANTWTSISVTIAGPTSGTWIGATNGVGMDVNFSLGTGTTYSGTAGAWAVGNFVSATGATSVVGTSGATFYITGVQLEVGSSATGFEYVDYTTQLAMCQRYCYVAKDNGSGNGVLAVGQCFSGTLASVFTNTPVALRIPPSSITTSGSFYIWNASGSATAVSSLSLQAISSYNMVGVNVNVASGLAAGNAGILYCASSGAQIAYNAEL
jgi:hypothetical protein